jgi:KaiC/GvpD/RAD55 family RecA-like ATPase
MKKTIKQTPPRSLRKAPTGIRGLDEITEGGLPAGRPTLVCGGAGCGKTLLGMEFLVRGATEFGEPGVFMAFEETSEELTENVASLGFDLPALVAKKKLVVDHVFVDRAEYQETGEYDLEGLFIRLGYAIDSIKAKRVVLDTIEVLFGALPNQAIVRSELIRLFRWLKDKGVTVVMTGERGDGTLTRHGLEEYVSDCVISLDHRVVDQVTTRRIRVVKYRGTTHGTNEYPFLIEKDGISDLADHFGAARARGVDGAHPDRDRASRHDARRQRISIAATASCFPAPRHRQDQRGGGLRRCDLPTRRALSLFLVRGIAEPDHAQHEHDRHSPRAVGEERAPRVSDGAPVPLRPRDAPGADDQGDQRVRARCRDHRSDLGSRYEWHAARSESGFDALDGLSSKAKASLRCSLT